MENSDKDCLVGSGNQGNAEARVASPSEEHSQNEKKNGVVETELQARLNENSSRASSETANSCSKDVSEAGSESGDSPSEPRDTLEPAASSQNVEERADDRVHSSQGPGRGSVSAKSASEGGDVAAENCEMLISDAEKTAKCSQEESTLSDQDNSEDVGGKLAVGEEGERKCEPAQKGPEPVVVVNPTASSIDRESKDKSLEHKEQNKDQETVDALEPEHCATDSHKRELESDSELPPTKKSARDHRQESRNFPDAAKLNTSDGKSFGESRSDVDSDEMNAILASMSSDDSSQVGSQEKLTDSEDMEAVIAAMCSEEERECKSSSSKTDSQVMDDVLESLCNEESEEEAIESVLEEMTKDDEQSSGHNDSCTDDLDNVLEEICNDDDEICKRVDNFLGKGCPPSTTGTSNNVGLHPEPHLSEAINDSSMEDSLIKSGKVDPGLDKDVFTVVQVICNVVSLQFDQKLCSEKIARMESLLSKKNSSECAKVCEKSGGNSGASVNHTANGCNSAPRAKETSGLAKRHLDEDGARTVAGEAVKKLKVLPGAGREKCTSGCSELTVRTAETGSLSEVEFSVSCVSVNGEEIADSVDDDDVHKKGEEEVNEACSSSDSGIACESSASSSPALNASSPKDAGNTEQSSEEQNPLSISEVKTCAKVEEQAVNVGEDSAENKDGSTAVPSFTLPQTFLPSQVLQPSNENSSDSDKSFCSKLKLQENVNNIIQSLSSPKSEAGVPSDDEADGTASAAAGSVGESSHAHEDVDEVKSGESEIVGEPQKPAEKSEISENDESEKSDGMQSDPDKDEAMDTETKSASDSTPCPVPEPAGELPLQVEEALEVHEEKPDVPNGFLTNGFAFKNDEEVLENLSAELEKEAAEVFNENDFVAVKEEEVEAFVQSRVEEYFMDMSKCLVASLQIYLAELKKEIQELRQKNENTRTTMREMATQQSATFRQHGYNPKVEKRTVGVNVRIVQQHTDSKMKTDSTSGPVLSQLNRSPQVPSKGSTGLLARTSTSAPQSVARTQNGSQNVVTAAGVDTKLANLPSTSPSAGKLFTPTTTSSVVLVTNSTASNHQVVDLTDEGDSPRRQSVASGKPQAQQLPKSPGANVLPVPIMTTVPSMVQLVPSGTSTSSPESIRMVRQTPILPQGARCVTYLPVLPQLAGNPPRQVGGAPTQPSQIIPAPRQNLQTIILTSMPVISTAAPTVTSAPRSPLVTATGGTSVTNVIGPVPAVLPQAVRPSQVTLTPCYNKHPAPLPQPPSYPYNPKLKALPPKPSLKMNKVANGIVLSWNMNLTNMHAEISSYQLYAYQENTGPVSSTLWKKVGDIKALPLPMACTLTQFVEGHKYHFTVRAVDIHKRQGAFSDPASILLLPRNRAANQSSNQGKQ